MGIALNGAAQRAALHIESRPGSDLSGIGHVNVAVDRQLATRCRDYCSVVAQAILWAIDRAETRYVKRPEVESLRVGQRPPLPSGSCLRCRPGFG